MAGQLSPPDTAPLTERAEPGFTLIELLVVIAILSVLTVGGAMLASRPADRAPSDLRAFQAEYQTLRSLSIHGRALRGLELTPRGRRMVVHRAQGWDGSAPELRWRGRVRIDADAGIALPGTPTIIAYPDGHTTPFRATFSQGDRRVLCRSDGWTELQCDGV